MTSQQIAIELSCIDWISVQGDCPFENDKVHLLKKELLKLSPEEIVKILVEVIEVNELNRTHPMIFKHMLDFKFL